MRSRVPLLLLPLLLVVAVLTPVALDVSPASSQASDRARPAGAPGIGIRLLDAPVATRDDPRARVYIVDHLAPGAVIERRIEVSNTTPQPQQVALYAAAATIDGGSFVGAPGHRVDDLSGWTTVHPGQSSIPAGGHLTARVTIAVPDDAAPGEQYGAVWAETRSVPSATGGVVQVSRVGIRLYVSIGEGGPPASDFTIETLAAGRTAEGRPTVSATVHNTGGRALDLDGTLRLGDGPGGLSAGPFATDSSTTLAVGDTQSVTWELDQSLPAGPWNARLDLISGLVERRAHAVITFPAAGISPPVAVAHAPARPWAPYIAAVCGLLLLLLLAFGWWWRRRGRRGGGARPDRLGVPVAVGSLDATTAQSGVGSPVRP